MAAVPVHIVAGFLGAGKTTAIRAQLEARTDERAGVIVNDFGEAALDEASLKSGAFRITNIAGACVCCTAPEGFVEALGSLLEERPDRIWIEPTGLARPQDLIDTIRRCPQRDALELRPVLVLLDPRELARAEADAVRGPLLREQAEVADILVANRTDLCSEAELAGFRRFAEGLWPGPFALHTARFGRLPEQALLWPQDEGSRVAPQVARNAQVDSTEGFGARTWRWPPKTIFSRARLQDALNRALAGDAGVPLVRFKGVFYSDEGVVRLEVAGGSLHESRSAHRRDSRADAIVQSRDAATLAQISEWLETAELDEAELQLASDRIEVVAPDGAVHSVDRSRLLALPDPVPDVSTRFPKRVGSAARVRSLFSSLRLPSEGVAVVVGGDGFVSEPVDVKLLLEGVLLHSLADEALSPAQGGPFRLLIPEDASLERPSCANVKGVAKLVLRA